MRILVVGQDIVEQQLLAHCLRAVGIIDTVSSTQDAFLWSKTYQYTLIVINQLAPVENSITFCKAWRELSRSQGIIIRGKSVPLKLRLRCFQVGADDVIDTTMPLSEVAARVRAVGLRAQTPISEPCMTSGSLSFYPNSHLIVGPFGQAYLRPIAARLLTMFLRRNTHLCTYYALVQAGWTAISEPSPNSVCVQIKYLRQQLEQVLHLPCIVSVHGLGYRWETPAATKTGLIEEYGLPLAEVDPLLEQLSKMKPTVSKTAPQS